MESNSNNLLKIQLALTVVLLVLTSFLYIHLFTGSQEGEATVVQDSEVVPGTNSIESPTPEEAFSTSPVVGKITAIHDNSFIVEVDVPDPEQLANSEGGDTLDTEKVSYTVSFNEETRFNGKAYSDYQVEDYVEFYSPESNLYESTSVVAEAINPFAVLQVDPNTVEEGDFGELNYTPVLP